jgi:hypothetical protein
MAARRIGEFRRVADVETMINSGRAARQHAAAAHRLAGDADRLARGPPDEVVGVGVQCVEIQHGEGRVDRRGRPVQTGPLRLAGEIGRRHAHHGERAGPAATGSR